MNILLSGYYGFDNTGDEAILLAISQELCSSGHQVVILSNNPSQSTQATGCLALKRMNPLAVLQGIWGCDVVFSGGGGLLQDKTSSRNLLYYLGIIRLARALGKKVVVFNQSIGPLSAEGQAKVSKALKHTFNIVRDQQSLNVLDMLGVTAQLGGDPALLLQPETVTQDLNTVVLAPRGDISESTSRLAELAQHLTTQGRNVVVLSVHPHVDDIAAQHIAARVPTVQIISTADPKVALSTIAQSGYVVGVRLHAVILAAASGTPFLGISYDPKVQGFCADAGAGYVPVQFEVNEVLNSVLSRKEPNWTAVEAMRSRAKESFTRALQK